MENFATLASVALLSSSIFILERADRWSKKASGALVASLYTLPIILVYILYSFPK
jgi:hypothetical protein